MFVRQSLYDLKVRQVSTLLGELYRVKVKLAAQVDEWNKLVGRINAKGGEDFLERGVVLDAAPWTDDDLRKLLQLCHPDRHDGKPLAVEMTQKLNEWRKGRA